MIRNNYDMKGPLWLLFYIRIYKFHAYNKLANSIEAADWVYTKCSCKRPAK